MIAAMNWGRRITRRKKEFLRTRKAPVFPPYLELTVAVVEKVWEILKGFGRDPIDRLRRTCIRFGPTTHSIGK
jgi:hypothetical protein